MDFSKTHIFMYVTKHTILTFVATIGWPIHQMDVNNAFLDAYSIRSSTPSYLPGSSTIIVWNLSKSLYDLKQPSWAW